MQAEAQVGKVAFNPVGAVTSDFDLTRKSQSHLKPVAGLLDKGFPNIVFVARMHSGKTTASKLLEQELGYTKFAFADRLKALAQELFPEQVKQDERGTYQDVGMKLREIYTNVWADVGAARAGAINAAGGVFCNDDCRFPNEVELLQQHKTVFVRLECEEGVRRQRLAQSGRLTDEAQLNHESETALDDFKCNYTIDNTHLSIPELLNELLEIIEQERRRH